MESQQGPSPHSGRNILIALDYTDESVRTVKWALGQHVRDGDRVTLLHVQPHHVPAAHSLPGPGPFAALHEREQEQLHLRQQQEERVTRRVQSWAQHYCPSGVALTWATAQVAPEHVALKGDSSAARECILSEAGKRHADCLIVGSHRSSQQGEEDAAGSPRGGLAHMAALGWRSVALGGGVPTSEYCAQNAPCPVIVVPPAPSAPAPAAAPVPASCAKMALSHSSSSNFLDSLAL